MKISRKADLSSPIVYLKLIKNDKLAVVTQDNSFSVLDIKSMRPDEEFVFNSANVRTGKKSVAFSADGKYLAYSEVDQSVVRLIDIPSRKLHHSFPTLKNRIETLCFDPHSHYLVAGSLTGRVYLWNLLSTGQVSRLSSFPEYTPHLLTKPKTNYVSAACFSQSGDLVATTGYGGSIVVTNIYTEVLPKRITPNHIRINALSFVHEDILASGNIEGAVDIIDLNTAQIKKHYQTGLGNIHTIAVSSSKNYLLVAGHTKNVLLIDLKREKIREAAYISRPQKINQLSISQDDVLYIGSEDGSITVHELAPTALLSSYINSNAYDRAYELIQEYPLLEDTPLILELEQEWESRLSDALIKIEHSQIDNALLLLKPFATVPSKKNILQDVQSVIQKFPAFNSAVRNENYALAYSIAEQTPLLKRSLPYTQMEAHWDECFHKAQTYVISNQKKELITILEPFSSVNSKLCFIQILLHQPELFLQFTHNVNTHAYENISAIIHTYPCLKEIQSYKNMLHAAEDLYKKSRQHIFSAAFDLAEIELEQLSYIPSMKLQTQELQHIYSLAMRLQNLYDEGDIPSCYALIDKHEVIQGLPLVKKLEAEWNTKMKIAEQEAQLGNIKKIKSVLGTLLRLSTRSQKIGTLLRLGFLTQIKYLVIKNQTANIQQAVEHYIHIFGYDTELNNLILKIRQDEIIDIRLEEEQMHHRPRSRWLNVTDGNIPNTILQGNT